MESHKAVNVHVYFEVFAVISVVAYWL